MKLSLIVLAMAVLAGPLSAQCPQFEQADMQTLNYEDLSDVLRRFPGMYPLDYGTLGAPVLFRPWNSQPWSYDVERDGIPQNRRYDGIYDSNLQPVDEIESIRFDALEGQPGGTVDLTTRVVPADSPYTDFQIREGYYGYGTIDFAHGQRVTKMSALQLTGRLAWYDGMRLKSASRFTRLRVAYEHPLGRRWFGGLEYGGSNDDAEFAATGNSYYVERSEGILRLHRHADSLTFAQPSVTFFARQDRERGAGKFRVLEQTHGLILQSGCILPRQRIRVKQQSLLSGVNFPGMAFYRDVNVGLRISDSVSTRWAGIEGIANVRAQMAEPLRFENRSVFLANCGLSVNTRKLHGVALAAGISHSETVPSPSWFGGSYPMDQRPLDISPSFTDSSLVYGTADRQNSLAGADRFLNFLGGLNWARRRTSASVSFLRIQPQGNYGNGFVRSADSLFLANDRIPRNPVSAVSESVSLPLALGLRVDSWWFTQLRNSRLFHSIDTRGFSRLYFERSFFRSPLVVRSHISYEHIGRRVIYTEPTPKSVGPDHLIGFRVSASIRGVTLIWGTENFFFWHYSHIPGYPMIGKEEYISVIWKLWL